MTSPPRIDIPDLRPSQPRQTPPRGYDEAREVERHAAVSQRRDDARTQAALDRLDQVLSAQVPPRQEVPRGYYLNITV